MNNKNLHAYQYRDINRAIRSFLKGTRLGIAVWTTGAGKSMLASCVADFLIKSKKSGITKIAAIAPQSVIGQGFCNVDKRGNVDITAWHPPMNFSHNASPIIADTRFEQVDKSTVKAFEDYIAGPADGTAKIFTVAALVSGRVQNTIDEIDDFSNFLLIIDESHHASDYKDDSTKLGAAIRKIIAKGGCVLFLSATPYRVVGKHIRPIMDTFKDIDHFTLSRSMGDQMRDGLAPDIEHVYVKFNGSVTSGHGNGIGDRVDSRINIAGLEDIKAQFITDWGGDGYPKCIIYIPSGGSARKAKLIKRYLERLKFPSDIAKIRKSNNVRVLNAVSVGTLTQKQLELEELAKDKESGGQLYDIILACRKFDEGADAPSASHAYIIGVSSNVRLKIQRDGRVMRNKLIVAGYEEFFGPRWMNKSKVTYYIPSNFDIKNLDRQTVSQVFACMVAVEEYNKYSKLSGINLGIRKHVQNRLDKKIADVFDADIETSILDEIENCLSETDSNIARLQSDMLSKTMEFMNSQPEITAKELIKNLKHEFPNDPGSCTKFVASLLDNVSEDGFDSDGFVSGLIDDLGTSGPKTKKGAISPKTAIDKAYTKIWEDLIDKYKNEKIKNQSMVVELSKAMDKASISLTGRDYKECADRLVAELDKLTYELIDFEKNENRGPDLNSKNEKERRLAQFKKQMKKEEYEELHGACLDSDEDDVQEIGL